MKEVHTFIARGREHPEAEMIYCVLDNLTNLLKSSGYLLDTSELTFLMRRVDGTYPAS